jgi:hypothetical protein
VDTFEYWRRVLTDPERQPRLLPGELTAAA